MNRDKLKKYLQWDTDTFGVGLQHILNTIPEGNDKKALELGANLGGISICLAEEKDYSVICSDLDNPRDRVITAHPGVKDNASITFDNVNGLDIKYPDASFDLVIFKSVLGYINSKEQQQHFINEIYRILKPGGYFCFLENSKASALHRFARKRFVSWGNNWRYITLNEMNEFLYPFSHFKTKTNGYFTVFAKQSSLKYIAYLLDSIIAPLIPRSQRYVIYGTAIK